MLTLYYAPNTCSLATHIALIEAGAPYELVHLSFASVDQRKPEFLALNPKGRVPALVTGEGILTETPALLAYVAQKFPDAKLAPLGDAFAFARAQAFNSYLCSTVHVAHAHRMRGYRWTDDADAIAAMQRKVPQSVTESFALIEDGMLEGQWVLGERFSICDAYLFTLAQWLEADGADLARLPKVLEHRARCAAHDSVRRAIEEELA